MRSHKKQHFVPKTYLRAWQDPNTPARKTPYVWQFSKDGMEVKRKAPENLFHETDMYTIVESNGERNLILEKGLSELESKFSSIRDKKLRKHLLLTPNEVTMLCAFVAAMSARTKSWREHQARQWGKAVELANRMRKRVKEMTPEERKAISVGPRPIHSTGITLSQDDIERFATKPLQSLLNRRTRFFADEFFIVNSNLKKDVWFNPGTEPDDSWEKTHWVESEDE